VSRFELGGFAMQSHWPPLTRFDDGLTALV
jgi:hypothetical protein